MMKTGFASRLETYGALAGAVLTLLAFFGTIGRPYAEDLVNEAVDERISKLETTLNDLRNQQIADRAARIRMETQIENSKELQNEIRSDIKALLRRTDR